MNSPTYPTRIDPVSVLSVKLGQNRKTVADAYREQLAKSRHTHEERGTKLAELLAELADPSEPWPEYNRVHDLLSAIEDNLTGIEWLERVLSFEGFPQ